MTVTVDFDHVYALTFARRRYAATLDYGELPPRFNTYRTTCQAAVRRVMASVAG